MEDAPLAIRIATRLRDNHKVESYLDVMDDGAKDGHQLAMHLREKMRGCSHLLAVVSGSTQRSWWVPWEIGVASERDLPLATFSEGGASLPTYLQKWPYLSRAEHLDSYVAAAQQAGLTAILESRGVHKEEAVVKRHSTDLFYEDLRRRLGQ
ncbi:hypothetical protein HY57_01900 [Dyella japonica A8]|uniref:Thoeris protein ThsB TIR-like domain-containing protein n=2 Tax=Dyella japonica TaxID=231455 RepID=A0A075JX45_9GAMM|nr:hypothetical protein HY57_01900 [Dyella japonica A8]